MKFDWKALLRAAGVAALTAILTALGLQVAPPPVAPVIPPPITIPTPPAPPAPPAPATLDAIARLSFNGVGCSATVIGPRRTDGRYNVLTAAHCCNSVGQRGALQFRNGARAGVEVKAINRTSDCAWMVTDTIGETLPYALLAEASPAPGTAIWHAGFGVDVPSNREDGTVLAAPNGDGQIRMRLSVSSGDSGGGIAVTHDGKIVSCVCCTATRGRMADVWGAGPEAIRALLPVAVDDFNWLPLELPLKR